MEKEEIVKYLIEKGYPVSTGGDIPTFEQSMQVMTDLYNYKKEEWLETACNWLIKNTYKYIVDIDDSRLQMSFAYTVDMIKDFRKTMEE